jgi:3-deoxy-D-manno-octulosonic-acid transferase
MLRYDLETGKWRTDWRGRFGHCEPLDADSAHTILVHGVSVGEVNAARELVRLLELERPPLGLAISSTTNTGVARARRLFGDAHPVVRFPFDFSWMVRRFLDSLRPNVVVLMELELWPNFLLECERRGIPTVVVNGRLSDGSFRSYQRMRRLVRPMFRRLTMVGAQTEEYARRFEELGVLEERIRVTDTMKWDNVELKPSVAGARELATTLGIDDDRPLVVAGSTGPGEEEMLIGSRPPGVQLLLVPRKPERFEEVARLVPGIVRRSRRPDGTPGAPADGDVFLLDTMGELEKAYALADVVVIGRSFTPLGGSDPIPSVALGRPTIVGPHHQNFHHVVAALARAGAVLVTTDPMASARALLEGPGRGKAMVEQGRAVISSRQGASMESARIVLDLLGSAEPVPGQ